MSLARVLAPPHLPALATVACACLLVAHTLNAVVEASLLPLPTWDVAELSRRPPPAEPPPARLSDARLAQLTGLTLADAARPGPTPPGEDALPEASGLKLLGTLVSVRPEASCASLYVEASRRARTVWPGSVLEGAEVLSIEREQVLVRQGERVARLGFGAKPPAAMPPPTGAPTLGAGIREVGPHAYVLPREELQRALAQPEQLMAQARIVPAFNGLADGFKVYVRPESLFARLGLLSGDKVQRLNGLALSGVENALEAYARLREASHFTLELERNGQPVRKTYTVSD
jgi:general secretion pathway protein C